jgi:hypothetical protein
VAGFEVCGVGKSFMGGAVYVKEFTAIVLFFTVRIDVRSIHPIISVLCCFLFQRIGPASSLHLTQYNVYPLTFDDDHATKPSPESRESVYVHATDDLLLTLSLMAVLTQRYC